MHVTFWKTVGAYLTGWLIVQPTYNRLLKAWRKRELENPSDESRAYWDRQAEAIVRRMARRDEPRVCPRCHNPFSLGGGHGPGVCIERRVVDRPMVVLYVPLESRVPASATQDADIVWRETPAGVECVKDRYGDPVCRPTVELIVAGAL